MKIKRAFFLILLLFLPGVIMDGKEAKFFENEVFKFDYNGLGVYRVDSLPASARSYGDQILDSLTDKGDLKNLLYIKKRGLCVVMATRDLSREDLENYYRLRRTETGTNTNSNLKFTYGQRKIRGVPFQSVTTTHTLYKYSIAEYYGWKDTAVVIGLLWTGTNINAPSLLKRIELK